MEWTDTERSGHRAFLLVEAVGPLVLAPILTMIYVGLRGHVDAYDESFITVYFVYVAGATVALSVIATPISVAWAVVRTVARDQSLGAVAFGRLLLVEGFIVAVCALSSNVLWPLQHDPGPVMDLWSFGLLFAIASILCFGGVLVALPFAHAYRNRRQTLNPDPPSGT